MDRPTTERTSPASTGIDTWDDNRILEFMAEGQERAIAAVRAALPQVGKAASVLASRLGSGGRLIYAGAGTSIRVGVQDGSELPATFGMPESRILYLIAGGRNAMFDTLADAEDNAEDGCQAAQDCQPGDSVIAIAASGTTPYTVAVAREARARGALVIAVVNNPGTLLGAAADIEIVLNSGPEVIAGSTRMGAGTAQKAALNLLSTLTHIKLGAVHDGLMVNVEAGNLKLKRRACGIVMQITAVSEKSAEAALEVTGYTIKPAVLLCAGAKDQNEAQRLLAEANGRLRLALARLGKA